MSAKRTRTAIQTDFKVGKLKGRGKIRNIGADGLFVGTSSVPEVGETVDLEFRSPCGGTVAVSGLVWWRTVDAPQGYHRVSGFGLRLLDDSEDYRRLVDGMMH